MSTRSSIFYALDESQSSCHIYWELAERMPGSAAPIYIEVQAQDRRAAIRLPAEIGERIRDILVLPGAGMGLEVI